MDPAAAELLVISDLHLGEGLGEPKTEHALRLERALIGFLDHHRATPGPKRLVVNGDMIELCGVWVPPEQVGLADQVHADDHQYGLGATEAGAVAKLRLILERHADVFGALGRFLASGHQVSIVLGNHDVELSWPAVQQLLTDHVLGCAIADGADPEGVRSALTFHPWFYLEEGVAWIEHGHQYDPYCSYEEILEPATDETEIDPSVGALLQRYIGPRMAESVNQEWNKSFFEYLAFWGRQGRARLAGIVRAYLDVCRRMVEHWQARRPERIEARKRRVRARLHAIAQRLRLPEERLREIASLAKSPVSVDLRRIVQALMLDRLLLLVLGPVLLVVPGLLLPWGYATWGLAITAVPVLAGLAMALVAREPVDPSEAMRASAREIRRRLRVPLVVMGHTHQPLIESDGAGGYLNTGHWVAQDPEHAFTHVRILRTEAGVRAWLCQWRGGASRVYDALHLNPSAR